MIIDTMLVYYGKQGTKTCIPTASIPGENPIGALALVCTAVGTHLAHRRTTTLTQASTDRTCTDHAYPGIFHQGPPFIFG